MIQWFKNAIQQFTWSQPEPPILQFDPAALGVPRNPAWEKLAKQWLKEHPMCAASGRTDFCVPHHKLPFQERPDLELEWENLITLSGHPAINFHLLVGHRGDWRDINPRVEEHSAIMLDFLMGSRDYLRGPECLRKIQAILAAAPFTRP